MPEVECCCFRLSQPGHAGGRGQSERPIQVTTLLWGGPPALRSGAYKGRSGAFDLSLPCFASPSSWASISPRLCSPSSCVHTGPLPAVIASTPPPLLRPHDADSILPTQALPSHRRSRRILWTTLCTSFHEARDDAPAVRGYRTTEQPPNRIGGAFGQACKGTERL